MSDFTDLMWSIARCSVGQHELIEGPSAVCDHENVCVRCRTHLLGPEDCWTLKSKPKQ